MKGKNKPTLLEISGIYKRFGGTQALVDVSFDLEPGEVHALMGENGAGKSTLMKILSGTVAAEGGAIRIQDRDVSIPDPSSARALGIATIHQELSNVPEMTVAENLALGHEPKTPIGALDRRSMNAAAKAKLDAVGLDLDPRTRMGSLTIGMQQLIEIARAVSEDARILILDEPTSALSKTESERLFSIIQAMKVRGVGMIYISHRMEEVWELSDRITVLRDGRLVGTQQTGEINPDDVVRMMVGRPLTDLYDHRERIPGEPALTLNGLAGPGVGPVDLIVRSGEVVCLTGLIGAGRTELARLVMGADKVTSGDITVHGKTWKPKSPGDSIAGGLGMVPEDRKRQALFLDHSVLDNTAVASLQKNSVAGVTQRRKIRAAVTKFTERMRLRAASLQSRAGSLSGGNQQKVVFARWLMNDADVLIMDEPTRGVDIGAKREIYELIDTMTAQGKAILMISSELPEALGVADRLVVMRNGQVVKEFPVGDATEEKIVAYATGTNGEA